MEVELKLTGRFPTALQVVEVGVIKTLGNPP